MNYTLNFITQKVPTPYVVLFLSVLFQSSFAKYFFISLYLPLCKFLLYVFLFLLSDVSLMSKCI